MNLDLALTELARDPAADYDVSEIALHLAKEEYPNLDVAAYLDQIRDLAREAHDNDVVVRHIAGLVPNAQGKLLLNFVPVDGYATVTGIEVLPQ